MVWFNPNQPFPGETIRSALSERSYAHITHVDEEATAEQEEGEEEEPEPDQRELDLWLLESQVPGCTRERAERAYEQGQEDVTRALPLARMATLLGDRVAMVMFLVEQMPGCTRWEAIGAYDEEREDVVEAVIALHRRTQQRLNQPVLSSRAKQRLRVRTVFMLALLYRERYGQLEQEAEEALARVPIEGRWRSALHPSFQTPDGSVWTHTRREGWERRAPLTPASLGRAVRATEQLADAADARGQAQTAFRARQTAADLQAQLNNDNDNDDDAPVPYHWTDIAAISASAVSASAPTLRRSDERARLVHTPDGPERYTAVVIQSPAFRRWQTPEDIDRWHDWDPAVDGSDDDEDNDNNDQPLTLASESSSSAEEEEEDETPTAGTYARPRPYARSTMRVTWQEARRVHVKNNLRIIQEQLDTEMANASRGVVMSEGAYLMMMTAIKVIWESVDPQPGEIVD